MSKRIPLILAALIACLAVGAVSASAKSATVGSTLKVKYKGAAPNDPYGTSSFSGRVGPALCAKGRKVKVKGVGSEKTGSDGKFSLTLSGPADPGDYKVSVAAKDVKDGDGTVTCRKVKVTLTVGKSG